MFLSVPTNPDSIPAYLDSFVKRVRNEFDAVRNSPSVPVPLALQGAWVAYGSDANGTWDTPAYRFTYNREVVLEGAVKSGGVGTGNPMFLLPVGVRPKHNWSFVMNNGSTLLIKPDGNGYLMAGAVTFISLAGVRFWAV